MYLVVETNWRQLQIEESAAAGKLLDTAPDSGMHIVAALFVGFRSAHWAPWSAFKDTGSLGYRKRINVTPTDMNCVGNGSRNGYIGQFSDAHAVIRSRTDTFLNNHRL